VRVAAISGLVAGTVVLSDDAGQFNVGDHALCWVHAERLIHKLDCFCERQRREKERIRTRIWWLYADLRAYKEKPARIRQLFIFIAGLCTLFLRNNMS